MFLWFIVCFWQVPNSFNIWSTAWISGIRQRSWPLCWEKKPRRHRTKDLLPWIRPVVNHFWYCCSISKGSTEKLLKRWCGILHHITNQHFWPGGRYVIHEHGKFHQLYHLFYSQFEELSLNSYMYFFTFLQMSSCNRSIIWHCP